MKLLTVNGILILFIVFRATSNDDVDNKNSTGKPTPLSYSERGTTQLCELDYLFIRSLVATLEQIQIVTNATSRTWPTLFTTHAIVKLKSNKTTLRSNKRLTKAFRTKIYDRFDMHRKRRRRNVDFSDLTSIEKEAIGLNNSDKDAWAFPGNSGLDGLHDEDRININNEQNKSTSDLEKGKTWKPMWGTSLPPVSASKLDQVAGETNTYNTPITHQQPLVTQKNANEEFLYEPEKEEEKKTENVNNLDYGEESKQTKIPCNETDTNFKVLKKVWVKQPGGVWKDIWTDMPLPLAPEHAKWFIKHSEPGIDLKPDHIDETSPSSLKAVQTWFKKEYIANDPSKVTECPGYGWTKIWRKQPDGKWKTEWKQIAATTQAMAKQMNVGDQSPKWTKVWIKQPDGGWKTGWKKVMATQSFEKKSWNQQPFSANNEMKPGDDGPRWTKVWLKQPDGKWKTGWKQVGPTQSYQKKTWNRQPFSANNEMKPDNGGSPGARWTKTWIKQPDGKWKTGWKQVVPTQSVDQPSWNKQSFSGNNEIKPDDAQSPQWTKVWQKQPDGKWKTLWKQVAPTQSINQQGWNKPSFYGSNDKKPEGDSMPGYTKVWIKQPDGKWKTSWKQVVPSQSVTEQMPMEEETKWTKVWLKQPDGKWKMEWKQVVPTQGVTTQMPSEGLSPSWTKVWIKQPDGKWKTGWKKVVPTQPITKQSWNKQQVPENNEEKHQDGPDPDSHIFWTQLPDGKWGTVWKKPESIPYSRSNQLNPIQELVKRFSLPVPAQTRVSLNWSRILEMRSDRTKIDHFSGLTSINPFMDDGPPQSHEERPPESHFQEDGPPRSQSDENGPPKPPSSHEEEPPKPHSSKEIQPPLSHEIEKPPSHELQSQMSQEEGPPISHEEQPPISHEIEPQISHEEGLPISNEDLSSPH